MKNNKYNMEKKFVIYDLVSGKWFTGSDWIYFSSEDAPYRFNNKEEAERRIESDVADLGGYISNRTLAILEVYYIK